MSFLFTRNFPSDEWTRSDSYPDLAADIEYVPAAHAANMQRHTDWFLQPARDDCGRLSLNSGYRPPALNTAVGSKNPDSKHVTGDATDTVPLDMTLEDFWLFIVTVAENGEEDEGPLWDRAAVYPERGFIHVDQRPVIEGEPRRLLYLSDAQSVWQPLTVPEARKVFSHG